MTSQRAIDGEGVPSKRVVRAARLLAARRAITDRGAELRGEAEQVAAARTRVLVNAFGVDRAQVILSGATSRPVLEAMERRNLVDRMSRDGCTVREIAAAARLSYGHVVAIRAQLGVGRKR